MCFCIIACPQLLSRRNNGVYVFVRAADCGNVCVFRNTFLINFQRWLQQTSPS